MAKIRQIRGVEFSKPQAFYWIVILTLMAILIAKSAYDAYHQVIDADRARIGTAVMISGFLMACQWNTHILRVLRTEDPVLRIVGENITAFGMMFPKGQNNYIRFEKRFGKIGYWTTLRNGDGEFDIPLAGYRHVEEYVDAPDEQA